MRTFQVAPMSEGPDKGIAPTYQNNDAATPSMSLPFDFCFYGQNFDSVFICNNGIISFLYPIYKFITSGGFPLGADSLIIAPFFADSYTRFSAGYVHYKITPTHMIVRWDSIGFETLDQDFWNTFQLIISDGTDPIIPGGNNVSFCYSNMLWASADNSGGFDGYGGIPAIVGINKGDGANYAQISTYNVPGNVYYGPFAAFNGLQWLNLKSFLLNTCVTGNTLPPVVLNMPQKCDTLTICDADTLTVTTTFLYAQQGQSATLAASYSGSSGISVLNSTTGNIIDTITVQLITSVADTGIHVLNVTATDNSSPAQTSTMSYTVIVQNCITGINESGSGNNVSCYPNPGKGIFTIEINNLLSDVNHEAKVFDVIGNEIYSAKLSNVKTQIDLSSKSKGVYFLKLVRENASVVMKKIIIH
ncbi:MAG: T9SS type A sorting domain-containing protein [Bacteroidota bacterium]